MSRQFLNWCDGDWTGLVSSIQWCFVLLRIRWNSKQYTGPIAFNAARIASNKSVISDICSWWICSPLRLKFRTAWLTNVSRHNDGPSMIWIYACGFHSTELEKQSRTRMLEHMSVFKNGFIKLPGIKSVDRSSQLPFPMFFSNTPPAAQAKPQILLRCCPELRGQRRHRRPRGCMRLDKF